MQAGKGYKSKRLTIFGHFENLKSMFKVLSPRKNLFQEC